MTKKAGYRSILVKHHAKVSSFVEKRTNSQDNVNFHDTSTCSICDEDAHEDEHIGSNSMPLLRISYINSSETDKLNHLDVKIEHNHCRGQSMSIMMDGHIIQITGTSTRLAPFALNPILSIIFLLNFAQDTSTYFKRQHP
ncbi:unnamed protein product [Caenorhabditis brenneri]